MQSAKTKDRHTTRQRMKESLNMPRTRRLENLFQMEREDNEALAPFKDF